MTVRWGLRVSLAVLAMASCSGSPGGGVDLTAIPEAWMVTAPRGHTPSRDAFLAGAVPPATARRVTADEGLLFGMTLLNGSRLEGKLTATITPGADVELCLVGPGGLNPTWRWHPAGSGPESVWYSVTVPDSGAYWGGVFHLEGAAPGDTAWIDHLLIAKPRSSKHHPPVILLTLDTFRSDHLSCISPTAPPTPTLDSLASRGVLCMKAMATSQATTPSHVSIMTGLYCFSHGVYQNTRAVSDQATTLAEVLGSTGYQTMGAVSVAHLNPEVSNLGQGFDVFLPSRWPGPEGEPADVRTSEVIRALLLSPPKHGPQFVWVHYFDPHTPYTPPRSLPAPSGTKRPGIVRYARGMGLVRYDSTTALVLDPEGEISRYRGEVAFLDSQIGRLLARLRALGVLQNAVVAVVGDHGEGLGEHEVYFQHAGMYEPILNVPLIFSGPGVPRGVRVTSRVSTLSVFPTMCALAKVASVPPCHGRNLMLLARGVPDAVNDVVFSESVSRRICAAWDGSRKLIWVPGSKDTDWTMPERVMFFDLAEDPAEQHNDLAGHEEHAKRLRDLWGEQVRESLVRLDAVGGNADTGRLKALGYLE